MNTNLHKIQQLIKTGQLEQALIEIEKFVVIDYSWKLSNKYSWICELGGSFIRAEQILISSQKKFPNNINPIVGLFDFYIRTFQIIKAHNLININQKKFKNYKKFQEIEVKFCKVTFQHNAFSLLAQKFMKKYPEEVFGYEKALESFSNGKSLLREQYINIINAVNNEAIKQIAIRKTNLLTKKIYQTSKNDELHQIGILKRLNYLHLTNFEKFELELSKLFESDLTFWLINKLMKFSQFSEKIELKLIQYLSENKRWQSYSKIEKWLDIITNNSLINSKILRSFQQAPQFDVVYTWCDFTDSAFVEKLLKITGKIDKTDLNAGPKRYQSNGEITLSLLSLQKYFNSVRNIFIVTNDQKFDIDFLSPEFQQKIKFVDHKEIFGNHFKGQEIFSSNIIETFLWRIEGLSEYFLYLNDDVILGDYLTNDLLVGPKNIPFAILTPRNLNNFRNADQLMDIYPEQIFYQNHIYNAINQFQSKLNINPYLAPLHQVNVLSKKACQEVFNLFSDGWENTFFKDFTRKNNTVYTIIMFEWYGLLKGYQSLGPYHTYKRRSIYFGNELNEENVELIKKVKPLFYCLNFISDDESIEHLDTLIEYLS